MNDRPAVHDTSPPADDETARAAVGPRPHAAEDGGAEEDEKKSFGEQEPTRFASDVEYRGRAGGHDYLVRVRHRLLDTSFTVVIDGIEHDPAAEEKARKKAKKAKTAKKAAKAAARSADEADSDGLRFRLDESFTVVRCTVRRRVEDDDADDEADGDEDRGDGEEKASAEDGDGEDPDRTDAEVISVRTAGLGGAGEVDVRHGLNTALLVPAADSPSAMRDEKRIAHPVRYAMLSALAKAAGFLIPLLGLGGLFSGLFDPVKEWVEARVRPVVDAISEATEPVRTWFGELMRPVVEFFDALFAPIRSVIAAVLRPVGEAWNWLTELLFGWIPDVSLPFTVPEWVVDAALPVIVVLIAFLVTFGSLRHRREKLDATRAATQAHDGKASASADEGDEGEREASVRSEVPAAGVPTGVRGHRADRGVPTSSDRSSTEPVRPQR